jgi:hypothetical protein
MYGSGRIINQIAIPAIDFRYVILSGSDIAAAEVNAAGYPKPRGVATGSRRKAWRRVIDVGSIPAALCLSCQLFAHAILAAETAKVSGVIYTVGSDQVQTAWPNAHVALTNLATGNEISTVSNNLGEKSFNTHTQIDWIIAPSQRLTAVLTDDPQETDFATIDIFNPSDVQQYSDSRHSGFFYNSVGRLYRLAGEFDF